MLLNTTSEKQFRELQSEMTNRLDGLEKKILALEKDSKRFDSKFRVSLARQLMGAMGGPSRSPPKMSMTSLHTEVIPEVE